MKLWPPMREIRNSRSAKMEAIDFLTDALAAGPRLAKELMVDARDAGITPKPLKSAKKQLGVISDKADMASGWMWRLPKGPSAPEGAHVQTWAPSSAVGPFGRDS